MPRQRAEQDVRPLVGEVADGRRVDPGVEHPGPYGEDAERGERDHAVAGDVLLAQRLGGPVLGDAALAVDLLDERLVDGLVLDDARRLQHPELFVEAHHRLGDLFEDVVGRLVHVVRDDHRRGQRRQRYGPVGRALVQGGQQVEVAEHTVEEVGLLLRVPVERVEVEFAALAELVDDVREVRGGGVGQYGLQPAEPHVEDVLRAAGGERGQFLARGGGPGGLVGVVRLLRLRVLGELDQPGVQGELPRLGRVTGPVLVREETEVFGGAAQLLGQQLAARADGGAVPGPAGELRGAREEGRGQRVPRELRVGVQPHRRHGGAVSGHQGVHLLGGTAAPARSDALLKRRRNDGALSSGCGESGYGPPRPLRTRLVPLPRFTRTSGRIHPGSLDNSLAHPRD